MDVRVTWSPAAQRDLDEIAAYIARDSRSYTASFVLRVHRAASQLDAFPESGGIVPEFGDPGIRERIV